jgi:hypothetical protein
MLTDGPVGRCTSVMLNLRPRVKKTVSDSEGIEKLSF